MRYIDRTGCGSIREKGIDRDIKKMGKLTRTATKIAEQNRLGVLKNGRGYYLVIRECGLGAYNDMLKDLGEVDDYLKHLDRHEDARL